MLDPVITRTLRGAPCSPAHTQVMVGISASATTTVTRLIPALISSELRACHFEPLRAACYSSRGPRSTGGSDLTAGAEDPRRGSSVGRAALS